MQGLHEEISSFGLKKSPTMTNSLRQRAANSNKHTHTHTHTPRRHGEAPAEQSHTMPRLHANANAVMLVISKPQMITSLPLAKSVI